MKIARHLRLSRRLSLLFRQPLLVILLGVTALIHIFWGKGQLDYIIEDMWVGLDKEVILSIPLFILCGNVMTRGSIAARLIRILASHDQAAARRHGRRLHSVVRRVRGHLRLVDRDHAGDRLGHVPGHARGRLRPQILARRHHVGRHARHHHPAVDPDDHLRPRHRDLDHRPVRGRLRAGHPADCRVRGLFGVVQPAHADADVLDAASSGRVPERHLGADDAGDPARRHLHRLLHGDRGGGRRARLCAAGRDLHPQGAAAQGLLQRRARDLEARRLAVSRAGRGAVAQHPADRAPRAAGDGRVHAGATFRAR